MWVGCLFQYFVGGDYYCVVVGGVFQGYVVVCFVEVGDGVGYQEWLDVVGVGVDCGDQYFDVGVYVVQY